jgi:hypothetical protein
MPNPWYSSSDLVSAIERKISLPLSQNTFSSDDVLAFANEEMMISLVPSVLTYHEEYFVVHKSYPLVPNQIYYPIPERAIGARIRTVFYLDENHNRYDMVRINLDDKGYFQYNDGGSDYVFRYYLEGNNIVLTPHSLPRPTGSLEISYYLRPGQLVDNSQAALVSSFNQSIVVNNTNALPGDIISLVNSRSGVTYATLTAVGSAPSTNEFLIDVSSIATATNLTTAIIAAGFSASNMSGTSATVTINSTNVQLLPRASNPSGFMVPTTFGVVFQSIPTNFSSGMLVDLLQSKPGFQCLAISIPLIALSGNTATFNYTDVLYTISETTMVVGDYMCNENQAIIPQIPSDLHVGLAERACARILAAIGDQAGLQATQAKITQIENAQSPLLGARSDGDGKKVNPRKSLLRFGKFMNYRRF